MTPEEIATEINSKNRDVLYAWEDYECWTPDEILALMDAAAMRGFQLGSNVALSMVQGSLLIQLARILDSKEKGKPGAKDKPAT